MAKVTFIKDGQEIVVTTDEDGKNLLELAQENDVDMEYACGGNGVCTTCMIEVKSGEDNLGDISEQEELMLEDPEDTTTRLGCQCHVSGDATVELIF